MKGTWIFFGTIQSDMPIWDERTRSIAGARMRRTRLQQRLSIRQLAELATISKTSVVQVETGRTSRRSTYLKIAEVLGLHLDHLLAEGTDNDKPYAVHRRNQDEWFDLTNFGQGPLPIEAQKDSSERERLACEEHVAPLNILASRLEQGRIKPTVIEVYERSETRTHAGEEHVFVLSGNAVVFVGNDSIDLGPGESITFWSVEPHSYSPASGSELPVRLLSVRVDA